MGRMSWSSGRSPGWRIRSRRGGVGPGSNPAWHPIAAGRLDNAVFSGRLRVPAGGWYTLQVKATSKGKDGGVSSVAFGVGEVFVTAGQSNSTNFGQTRQSPFSGLVVCFDGAGYRVANDPQPFVADLSAGGSPWPILGDLVASEVGVPVAFISTGYTGTDVARWLPGAPRQPGGRPNGFLFERLTTAIASAGPNGIRAVLWHQGEADTLIGTSTADYAARLQAVIAASRGATGLATPWGIAHASTIGPYYVLVCGDAPGCFGAVELRRQAVRSAQAIVAAQPLNFAGPDTDLLGAGYRVDGVHMNQFGLDAHAAGWSDAIASTFFGAAPR